MLYANHGGELDGDEIETPQRPKPLYRLVSASARAEVESALCQHLLRDWAQLWVEKAPPEDKAKRERAAQDGTRSKTAGPEKRSRASRASRATRARQPGQQQQQQSRRGQQQGPTGHRMEPTGQQPLAGDDEDDAFDFADESLGFADDSLGLGDESSCVAGHDASARDVERTGVGLENQSAALQPTRPQRAPCNYGPHGAGSQNTAMDQSEAWSEHDVDGLGCGDWW